MAMFKRMQEAESDSGTTAMVFFYFWFAGISSLLIGAWALYQLTQHKPNAASVLATAMWLVTGSLSCIGAWLVGRFNRNGIMLISIALLMNVAGWILWRPGTREVVFTVMTAIALIIAWRDLTESPLSPR